MDKTTPIAAASYAGLGLVAFARPSFIPDPTNAVLVAAESALAMLLLRKRRA